MFLFTGALIVAAAFWASLTYSNWVERDESLASGRWGDLSVLCEVPEGSGEEPTNPPRKYVVIARDGKFKPNHFHFYPAASATLDIFAADRDYFFTVTQLPDDRFAKVVKKGEHTVVELRGVNPGVSSFKCGPECGGTIFMDRDLDDYCEEWE